MVSEGATISIDVDTTLALTRLDELDALINQVAQKSIETRNQVMQDVRYGLRVVQTMLAGMNIATRILRLNLTPWQRALLSLVATTVATMQSVAAAMATTIVGIPASLIIASAALGLQVGVTIEMFTEMAEARSTAEQMAGNIQSSRMEVRSIISGLGGF